MQASVPRLRAENSSRGLTQGRGREWNVRGTSRRGGGQLVGVGMPCWALRCRGERCSVGCPQHTAQIKSLRRLRTENWIRKMRRSWYKEPGKEEPEREWS